MKHRILVIDDHPIMRWGYASLINREADLKLCCEAGSAEEVLDQIETYHPDLIIIDITLGDMNGIELTRQLKSILPGIPVLIVSMHDETLYAERALRAGARGYIMKSEVHTAIIKAIHRVLNGHVFVSEKMNAMLLSQYAGHTNDIERPPVTQLTDRELQVFEHMGRGLSTREIARSLHISPKTVEAHRGRIKSKLGVETTAKLFQRAVQWVESGELC